MSHSAENGLPGASLDLDFIDYPTGWAIQRAGLDRHWPQCSAEQTNGAMLCDCTSLVYKWAELKAAHERARGRAEVVNGVRAWCAINEIASPPLDWEGLGEFLTRVTSPGAETDQSDTEQHTTSVLPPGETDN